MSDWISVEDSLPDDATLKCIVYYENDCASVVSTADAYFELDGFNIFYKGRWRQVVGVTHWMPLPLPPQNQD